MRLGDVIDQKYEVRRLIGEGAMGAVYEAHHLYMNRPVALKTLHAQHAADQGVISRFINEARAAATIGSAHVVEVTDAGQLADGTPYIVMERLQGEDLQQRLAREGWLPVSEAVDLISQACHALELAHRRNIIHRDLKPANLFFDGQSGLLKILDFGVAKFRGDGPGSQLTADGATLGTPRYMAPEQFGRSSEVDHLVDIYALGVILYELLTGRPPFQASTLGELLVRITMEAPPPIRALRPEVDDGLVQVVLRSMSSEPTDRFRSAGELGRALRPFAGALYHAPPEPLEGEATAPAAEPPAPGPSAPSSPADSEKTADSSRQLLLLAGLTLGVLTLIALLSVGGAASYYLLGRSPDRGPRPPPTPSAPRQPQPPQAPQLPQMPQAPPMPQTPTVASTQQGPPGFPLRPYEQMVDVAGIDVSGAPSKGPAEAPVVVYEFSDYQCPPCARAHATAVSTWERHRDQVRLVALQFPIDAGCNRTVPVPNHAAACPAAALAVCAGEQGRFWEVSRAIYQHSTVLDQSYLARVRAGANLDEDRLEACLESERPSRRITTDVEIAARLGVSVTPVHVVNGLMILGDPGPRLEQAITHLIARRGRWQ